MTTYLEDVKDSPATRSTRRRLLVVWSAVVAVLVAGAVALAVAGPEALTGRDAGPVLRARLERVELPPALTRDGDDFDEAGTIFPPGQCFDSCPSGSAYYASTLPPAELLPLVERALREAGFEVERRGCSGGCTLHGADGMTGATEYQLSIVDGRYDGYVSIGTRAGGAPGMQITLGIG